MARFNGFRQGVAVWLWAVTHRHRGGGSSSHRGIAYDVLANRNFPRIPVNEGTLTTAGVLTAVGIAAVSLVGAVLGGLAGMRFHRRVDKAGLD